MLRWDYIWFDSEEWFATHQLQGNLGVLEKSQHNLLSQKYTHRKIIMPEKHNSVLWKDFPTLVKNELERARGKHPGTQHSLHEGYAVILEEVDEFWDIVKSQRPDPVDAIEELVQIAAMCQRTAEDLLLRKEKRCSRCNILLSENIAKYCGDGEKESHRWMPVADEKSLA